MSILLGKPKHMKVIDFLTLAEKGKDLPRRIIYDGRTYLKDNNESKSLIYHDVMDNMTLMKRMVTKSHMEIAEYLSKEILVLEW